MKDSEFIELLNLYLDHEIGADDAARLEAEVQSNPARRRLYRNYCQMQKACKVLAQDFAESGTADSEHKVVAFPAGASSARRVNWYIGGAFAAAAACVAVIVASHRHAPVTAAPAVAVAPAATPASEAIASISNPTSHRGIARGQAGDLSLRPTDPNLALATAAQNDPHFAWMQDIHLTPLQIPSEQQLNLKAGPSPKLESRGYVSGNKTLPSDVQWTAVRFQR